MKMVNLQLQTYNTMYLKHIKHSHLEVTWKKCNKMNNNSIFQSFLSICYKRLLTESVTDIINNYLINLAYEKLNDTYVGDFASQVFLILCFQQNFKMS